MLANSKGGYGGSIAPSLGDFNPQGHPLLQVKVVSASATPLVTGRFTEPCVASGATPCIAYVSEPLVGNVQIAWQSNFTGLVDIKRRVASNLPNPSLQTLRLNATATGAMLAPFTVNRIDELQLTKAGTNELLATMTVSTLYDECLALPALVNGATCPKGREASLDLTPALVCVSAPNTSQCNLNAAVAGIVLPLNSVENCIETDASTNNSHCGGLGFSRTLIARPYLQTVSLRDRVRTTPFELGCTLSGPINYCARYALPSSGSLTALPCAFNGSNCTTTFSVTKSSALRSCLWRIGTPTTKLFCSEAVEWSLPRWNGLISGPTVIELRASNDRIKGAFKLSHGAKNAQQNQQNTSN